MWSHTSRALRADVRTYLAWAETFRPTGTSLRALALGLLLGLRRRGASGRGYATSWPLRRPPRPGRRPARPRAPCATSRPSASSRRPWRPPRPSRQPPRPPRQQPRRSRCRPRRRPRRPPRQPRRRARPRRRRAPAGPRSRRGRRPRPRARPRRTLGQHVGRRLVDAGLLGRGALGLRRRASSALGGARAPAARALLHVGLGLRGVLGRGVPDLALLRILWLVRAHRTLPLESWPR